MKNLLNSIGWLFSIAATTGNGFVAFLVAKNRRLHSSANRFVLSLAIADFGVGCAVFPSSYFCHYSMACNSKVHMAFFWFFLHSSVTNLCTLTLDRYIAIVHPLKYITSMTKRRPGMVILAAWLIPFTISLLLCVGMYVTNSNTALKILRLSGVTAFDIICCSLLFYAVLRILMVARSHQKSATKLQVQSYHSSTEVANLRRPVGKKHSTARFLIAIVVLFLGCYMVVNYLVLCLTFSCHNVSDQAGQVITSALGFNSAVNPLIYACLKRDIKRQIKKLIGRGDNRRKRSSLHRHQMKLS